MIILWKLFPQLPNHLVWLCLFYLLFHSFLNALGEVLNFADRNFYCDWWNANNIDTFWRSWNMPVHRWCVRHLYIPIVQMGYSSRQASTIVFLFSAFFHEYLVKFSLESFLTFYSSLYCFFLRSQCLCKRTRFGLSLAWWRKYRCRLYRRPSKRNWVHAWEILSFGHLLFWDNLYALWPITTISSLHISRLHLTVLTFKTS